MKKALTALLPLIFSGGSVALYYMCIVYLENKDYEAPYVGAGLAILAVIVWAVFIVPIYSVLYTLLLKKCKNTALFVFYNVLVISVTPLFFFFGLVPEIIIAFVVFGVWVAIWNVIPVLIRKEKAPSAPS